MIFGRQPVWDDVEGAGLYHYWWCYNLGVYREYERQKSEVREKRNGRKKLKTEPR